MAAGRPKTGHNFVCRQVTLTPEQDSWLDMVAKERNVSRATIVREALDRAIDTLTRSTKEPICTLAAGDSLEITLNVEQTAGQELVGKEQIYLGKFVAGTSSEVISAEVYKNGNFNIRGRYIATLKPIDPDTASDLYLLGKD